MGIRRVVRGINSEVWRRGGAYGIFAAVKDWLGGMAKRAIALLGIGQ